MQYMLYECSANTVPLEKEFTNIENYNRIGKSITEGLAYAFDNDTLAENSAVY